MFAQIFVIGATIIAAAQAGLLGHRLGGFGQNGLSPYAAAGNNFNGAPIMPYSLGYAGSLAHTGSLAYSNSPAFNGPLAHSNLGYAGPHTGSLPHAGPLPYAGPLASAGSLAYGGPLAHSSLLGHGSPLNQGALSYSAFSQTSALNHPQSPAYSSPLSHASSNARAISHVDRTDVIQTSHSAGQVYGGIGQLAHATSLAHSAPLTSTFNLANSAPYNAPLHNTGSLAHATHYAHSPSLIHAESLAYSRPLAQAAPLGYAAPLSHNSPLSHGTSNSQSLLNAAGPLTHAATINGLGRYGYARQYAGAENYFSHPKYQYSYSVEDPHTGDHKAQQESRDGDVVKGEYSLLQPDGSFRKVSYAADDHHGFNAVVQNSGPSHHVYSSQHHH